MVTRLRSSQVLAALGGAVGLVALILLGVSLRLERMRAERMVLSREAIAILDQAVADVPKDAVRIRARHSITKQVGEMTWLQGEFVLEADAAAAAAVRARAAELGAGHDLHVVADGEYTENGHVVQQWSLRSEHEPLVQVRTRIPEPAAPAEPGPIASTTPQETLHARAAPVLAAVRRETRLRPIIRPCPPQAAIIIDDVGYVWPVAKAFLEYDRPLTLSVFPHLQHSKHIAHIARRQGREIMMHLPMESPSTRLNPGTLRTDMSPEELLAQWEAALDTLPGVVGLNNHQGSLMTADEEAMRELLALVRAQNMFFIDSRTTVKTVARRTAERMGVSTNENDMFLDNVKDVEYIKQKCRDLLALALVRGEAIGIGHAHPVTLQALQEVLPEFDAAGVQIVYVSALVT